VQLADLRLEVNWEYTGSSGEVWYSCRLFLLIFAVGVDGSLLRILH